MRSRPPSTQRSSPPRVPACPMVCGPSLPNGASPGLDSFSMVSVIPYSSHRMEVSPSPSLGYASMDHSSTDSDFSTGHHSASSSSPTHSAARSRRTDQYLQSGMVINSSSDPSIPHKKRGASETLTGGAPHASDTRPSKRRKLAASASDVSHHHEKSPPRSTNESTMQEKIRYGSFSEYSSPRRSSPLHQHPVSPTTQYHSPPPSDSLIHSSPAHSGVDVRHQPMNASSSSSSMHFSSHQNASNYMSQRSSTSSTSLLHAHPQSQEHITRALGTLVMHNNDPNSVVMNNPSLYHLQVQQQEQEQEQHEGNTSDGLDFRQQQEMTDEHLLQLQQLHHHEQQLQLQLQQQQHFDQQQQQQQHQLHQYALHSGGLGIESDGGIMHAKALSQYPLQMPVPPLLHPMLQLSHVHPHHANDLHAGHLTYPSSLVQYPHAPAMQNFFVPHTFSYPVAPVSLPPLSPATAELIPNHTSPPSMSHDSNNNHSNSNSSNNSSNSMVTSDSADHQLVQSFAPLITPTHHPRSASAGTIGDALYNTFHSPNAAAGVNKLSPLQQRSAQQPLHSQSQSQLHESHLSSAQHQQQQHSPQQHQAYQAPPPIASMTTSSSSSTSSSTSSSSSSTASFSTSYSNLSSQPDHLRQHRHPHHQQQQQQHHHHHHHPQQQQASESMHSSMILAEEPSSQAGSGAPIASYPDFFFASHPPPAPLHHQHHQHHQHPSNMGLLSSHLAHLSAPPSSDPNAPPTDAETIHIHHSHRHDQHEQQQQQQQHAPPSYFLPTH